MQDDYWCVLGQLYGEYIDGRDELGLTNGKPYGFDIPWDRVGGGYQALNELWNAQIMKRRSS